MIVTQTGFAKHASTRAVFPRTGVSHLVFVVASVVLYGTSASAVKPVEFTNDLIPILTKSGCNAGACHGAAVGRGGFKLSLYGGNPDADYDAVVRHLRGRRVNQNDPAQSLILLKPTEQIEHGGGSVFDHDSDAAALLTNWIQQGAVNQSTRRLVRVEISHRKHVLKAVGDSVSFNSIAHYSDGSQRDVTRWTIFTAEDNSAVNVDQAGATAVVNRRGRHVVVARYLNQVVPIELIVPLSDSPVDLADEPRRNFIDDAILQSLSTLRIPVSLAVDDATFLRRVSLDLTGRLPDAKAIPHNDKPIDRSRLVDQLLASEPFVEFWTLKLAKLFRLHAGKGSSQAGLQTYHRWLADQVRKETPYNKIAQSVILASGDTTTNGPANFYRTVAGPREQAEFVSELFMGSRLRCANCHNHPLDRWTQDDYHGLAAIFAKIEMGQIIKPKPRGEVIHPRTLESASLRIPGERFLLQDSVDGRKDLADWLTDPTNEYFAKAIVNRLWKSMMGRGLVEPADDFRSTNPATHPELLNQLAKDFVANDYSLKHTLRLIANSTSYARSADTLPANRNDDRFYSHALRQPLEPEVLADAISDVLGVADKYGELPAGTRAVALVDSRTKSPTLDILGRCDRTESCETSIVVAGSLPQKLHLFNGDLLNARIAASGSRLDKLLAADTEPMKIVATFYQAALSRSPTTQESEHWAGRLSLLKSGEEEREFLEDFVWSLMTCSEFTTNH